MSYLRLGEHAPDAVAALRGWLAEDEPRPLLIETSGSTGAPKRVVLSRAAVLASAQAAMDRLGGPGRWVLALPASYVAGVQVIVRSLLAESEPALRLDAVPDRGTRPARERWFTSLVPTQLHRLLESPEDYLSLLTRFDAVLLGGGSVDPALRARAREAGVRLVTTYGSSETAGGCVYDGVPLEGVEVRIGATGRVELRGSVLFDRYEGDPELTAETLVDGWFRTADLGSVDDGRLRVIGRIDDVVISGGVNIPAPAVEARLRAHRSVRDVAVLGVPDPEWGHRLVAFVVGDLSLEEARDWVAAAHPRTWAPRELRSVERLPLLANGKLDRTELLG